MEVIIPGQTSMGFEFNHAQSSPRYTVPSTPPLTGEYYFSAPASPTRISQFCRDFDEFFIDNNTDEVRRGSVSSAAVPFDWEEKPGTPKSVGKVNTAFEDDFAFDLSKEMETASIPANELFDGGKIRPMKPPPPLQFPHHNTTKNSPVASSPISDHKRGRLRSVSSLSSLRSAHRATRSLSPLRVSEYPWEEEHQQQHNQNLKQSSTSSKPTLTSTNPALSSSSSMGGNKKWKLKDFFLFRSASEGRATDKDPLKKYASFFRKHEDLKSTSFRSIDSPGSSVSSSRRRGQISAHELHYTMNRAASEDLKKKTFLPYKQGILGRLAVNPAVHAIANGFGFSHK